VGENLKRRLTAIFYADVAGYSRLTGEDEVGTHRQLTAALDLISKRIKDAGGRVVHYAGDAVLANFDSVVAAVKAAVGIQRALAEQAAVVRDDQRFQFRIGVNLGEVIVDRDEIYGDGVNVAARLESLAEPGGICVSGAVVEQVKGKLDVGFEDMGPQTVKNISTPVRTYRVQQKGEVPFSPTAAMRREFNVKRLAGLVVVVLFIVAGLTIAWWRPREPVGEPPPVERMASLLSAKPSIAILPFANLSEDRAQEYFADGLAEDLITDLSKVSGLFVIARNSSFSYKGRNVNVREVAEHLGVRYVLEGSVRRAGDQVRINVQLIDATTGGHLWAERYDGALSNIFALQDRVTQKVVSALAVKLTKEDREALEHSDRPMNLIAYEYVLRGRAKLAEADREATLEARKLFERAIEADSKYARAYVNLGLLHYYEWRFWGLDRDQNMERALELAREAVALDETSAGARILLALILQSKGEHDSADREADRALSIGNMQAETLGNLGGYLRLANRCQEAVDILERAILLDPFHSPDWLMWRGNCYVRLDKPEKAITLLERGVKRAPDYAAVHLYLAIALAMLDRMEEARAHMTEVLRINPRFSIESYVRYVSVFHRNRDSVDRETKVMARIGFPVTSRD